jgi:hypothetical protein
MLTEAEALQRFIARLPLEAREAIRTLEIAGSPEIEAAVQRVERVLVNAACIATMLQPEAHGVRHAAGAKSASANITVGCGATSVAASAVAASAVAAPAEDVIALAGELD